MDEFEEQNENHNKQNGEAFDPHLEDLWQFAGQGLRSGEFNTAMVHFYRGEVTRSNMWRGRLDATTNWAVVTTGAALSIAFSNPTNAATIILFDSLLVLMFLLIEARRYRYYELWASRVRLMEVNFFAGLLSPPFMPHAEWADQITESLIHPKFPISLLEAIGRRYRRNYAPIFVILALSWIFKLAIHPTSATSLMVMYERSAIGPIPAWLVLGVGVVFNAGLFFIGFVTASLRETTSEVFDDDSRIVRFVRNLGRRFRDATWDALEMDLHAPTLRRSRRKQLAYIISDKVDVLSKALMDKSKLGRGVTLLEGKGMYTGQEHGVLMCVIDLYETDQLRKIVSKVDPNAFVVVTQAHDVRGTGFRPLG